MNTSIQTLSFQNFPVSFRADGYLNATEIAEHFGKRINNYLRNERTQEYIAALVEFLNIPETRNRATAENQLVITQKGGNDKSAQGTWLHPKLAVDFARWLNPKFAVWCDMQIEKILHQNSASPKPIPNKTTSLDREPLRNAVNLLVSKKGLNYSEAYKLVHQRFNVAHLDELDSEQIPQAVEYVHRVLCGEVLDKEEKTALPDNVVVLSSRDVKHLDVLFTHLPYMLAYFQRTHPAVSHLNKPIVYRTHDRFGDGILAANLLAGALGMPIKSWRDVVDELYS